MSTGSGGGSASELLTLPQVAEYLGLAQRTLYLWAQQGKIPAFKLGTSWRFRRSDIDAWLETQRSGPSVSSSADMLTDPREPRFSKRRMRLDDEVAHEALIEACTAFITTTMRSEDREVWVVQQFVDRFTEEIAEEAIKRLSGEKKVMVTEERGLGREKVRVLKRRE